MGDRCELPAAHSTSDWMRTHSQRRSDLLVSASRKAERILPKGGWELDETMEESGVRESFEEASVLGALGTKLSEIEYKTRKSRKRKLELEEMMKRKKEAVETGFSSGASDVLVASDDENQATEKKSAPPSLSRKTCRTCLLWLFPNRNREMAKFSYQNLRKCPCLQCPRMLWIEYAPQK